MKEPPMDSTLSHFSPLHISNTSLPEDTSVHSTSPIPPYLKICISFNLPFSLSSPAWSFPHEAFQPTDPNNPIYSLYCLAIFIQRIFA